MTEHRPARTPEQRAALSDEIATVTWYHSIDLGDGIVTPGHNSAAGLARSGLPSNLEGWRVLDIGAWDGFWSFECERRGASQVLATDSFVWSREPWAGRGFDLAHRELDSGVEKQLIDVMELEPSAVGGRWDLVLFLGVLYHLRDPIAAIERVASVTERQLILETVTALDHSRHPASLCFPGRELSDDETNWWALNEKAIVGLLRDAGFTSVRRHYRSSLRGAVGSAMTFRDGWQPSWVDLRCRRSVFHAIR